VGRNWLRERCLAALQQVEIPDPFDIQAFANQVSRHRGRPVRLVPKDDVQGPCGAWLPSHEGDYVFYEPNTGHFHRDHIVLHELGHLLMGHDAQSFWTDEAPTLLPDLDLKVIATHMLARSSHDDPVEQEAEMIATLVQERVRRRVRGGHQSGAEELSKRLHVALGSQAGKGRHG
jgi:hypothetical protein